MITSEAKGASIRLSVDLFPFLSLSSLPQQKILHVNVCNLSLQRSCRGVTASPTRNWTPQPGLPSTSARSFLSSLWRTFRHLALRRYWTLFGGIMSFTKIWIAKDMRINNLTPTVFLCRISRCSQWTLSTSHSSTTPSYLPTSPTTTLSSFISRTATSVPYCESKPLKCGFTFQPQASKYFFRHYVRERYYAIWV